jgi:hypothetical protein
MLPIRSEDTPPPEKRHEFAIAETVDLALDIASREGIGPAIDFMFSHGVSRQVALRVLSAPEFHRKQ